MTRTRPHGIAMAFVLFVITLLLIVVINVTQHGIGSLQKVKLEQFRKQALYAAEAGVNDGIRQLVEDQAWPGPIALTDMPSGAEYEVEISNNFAGSSPLTSSNGAEVPPGYSYIFSRGRFARNERRVGVLVSPSSLAALGLAVGVGGNADMKGSKDILGSIKASGDIRFQGSSNVNPIAGSGRILAGGDIKTQGATRVDESQDLRARGSISSQPAVRGALLVQENDTSESSLPFIADGRTTNVLQPGEEGLILPNPDQTRLLDLTNPALITHTETVFSGSLNLNNQIHYFPDGIEFTGGSKITGEGTIVVGNGNQIVFQGSAGTLNANLIALRSPAQFPAGGNPSISFQGKAEVNGLIYAHEDVNTQGNFTLNGVLIAYRDGGGDLTTQGKSSFTLDSSVLNSVPGFEAWANGFGGVGASASGSGAISVVSWERL